MSGPTLNFNRAIDIVTDDNVDHERYVQAMQWLLDEGLLQHLPPGMERAAHKLLEDGVIA